jgi:hypothetical protein
MKIKQLKNQDLVGIKVKIPKKFQDDYQGIKGQMFIFSWWAQGVWFKKSLTASRIYPLSMNPKELLNFEVVNEDKV